MRVFHKKAAASEPASVVTPKAVAAGVIPAKAKGIQTDEGVPYLALDTETIVNLADHSAAFIDARRRELHVHGQPYHHVSDDALGQWVYRHDQ